MRYADVWGVSRPGGSGGTRRLINRSPVAPDQARLPKRFLLRRFEQRIAHSHQAQRRIRLFSPCQLRPGDARRKIHGDSKIYSSHHDLAAATLSKEQAKGNGVAGSIPDFNSAD